MATKQVLQIDYKQQKGLMLKWKYTGLNRYLTFFRHVIVLLSENKQNITRFLRQYIKRMRSGDLYTIFYFNHTGNVNNSSWRQKMLIDQNTNFDIFIKDGPFLGNQVKMMAKVEQQFGQFSQPTLVTIYTDNIKDREWVQSRIEEQRRNQYYDFIVGVFGHFKSASFSFSNGIPVIPFEIEQDFQGIQFYLNQIYQSAVIWASVTIQCSNGSINSTNQSQWKNINFNTIERVYRGPSVKYEKDVLMFYRQKLKQMDYNLILKLTYVTLQKRKYFSQKQFSVHSFEPYHLSTYCPPAIKPYHVFGDVWLDVNPFKTITTLKFQPQNADQCT